MPSTYRSITARVVSDLAPGDPRAAPNTFVRDPGLAGFAILIGRSRSSYIVEGRAGRTGRNVRVTLGTVGRLGLDEARTQAKDAIARLAAGRDPVKELRTQRAARRMTAITFAGALDDLAKADRVKASTLHDYRRSLAALGWLDRKLASVKPDDVRKAYEARKERATSAGRIFRSLRSVWNFARAQHPTLPPCPTLELKTVRKKWATAPRKQRVIPDALTPAWRKQVLALDRDDVRDLLLLLHYTGMRIGEVRALAVEHVDMAAGSFVVADPKNKRPLALPIVKQVAPILKRRLAAVGNGSLFPFGDVRKSHASVDAAPWSYHDLRRLYVTVAHRAGIDDLIARALTNHAPLDTDSHGGYAIFTADSLRPHAQAIADYLDALGKVRTARKV